MTITVEVSRPASPLPPPQPLSLVRCDRSQVRRVFPSRLLFFLYHLSSVPLRSFSRPPTCCCSRPAPTCRRHQGRQLSSAQASLLHPHLHPHPHPHSHSHRASFAAQHAALTMGHRPSGFAVAGGFLGRPQHLRKLHRRRRPARPVLAVRRPA